MKCATAVSTNAEPTAAVREVIAGLDRALGGRPAWVLLSHVVSLDAEAVQRAWAERAPGAPAHRLTSCRAVMGDFGLESGVALAAFGIVDEGGAFGVAAESLVGGVDQATTRALVRAMAAADRGGEAPDLVFVSSAPGAEEEVLAAIRRELGPGVPVAGGSAADDTIEGRWSVGDSAVTHSHGVVVSVLYPSRTPSIAFSDGYLPAGIGGVVTAADGRRVARIDGQPAAEVYDRWTGGAVAAAIASGGGKVLMGTSLHPLGRSVDHSESEPRYVLSHPAEVHADGSMSFFSELAVGDRVELMQGTIEGLIGRAPRVVDSALRGTDAPAAGALVVYCAGCMLTVGEQMPQVPARISEFLGVPFLGVFTFGEQGRLGSALNRHGNLMISVIVFHG